MTFSLSPFFGMRGRSFLFSTAVAWAAIGFAIDAESAIGQESTAAEVPVGQSGLSGQAAAENAEPSPEDEKAAEEAVKQKIAQRRQFFFDALLEELDNMVPGEYEEGSPQKAELEKAVNAFLDRDVPTVRRIFQEQATFDPDFPPMNMMLASMSYRVRNPTQGRRLLEKAAIENPRYPGTYAAFARLALNENRITDAMALLDKCARMVRENKVSDKVKAHFGKQYIAGMMQVAIAQSRYQDARELLERQMKQLPDNPKSYLTGAEIEFKAGNLDKSQSYLEKLKELEPRTRPHEAVFASWFRQKGSQAESAKWLLAAADNYPKDARIQLDKARLLLGQEKIMETKSAIGVVEAITGETAATRYLKAQLAFADSDFATAEKLFESVVVETKGRNLEALNFFALSMAESGEEEKMAQAQTLAQQLAAKAQHSNVAKASLAYILVKRGTLEPAQRLLVPIARQKRVSSEVAYFFGCLLRELGEKDTARQAFQSALKNKNLFVYRKECVKALDELGGPIAGDLPDPAATETPAVP